MNTATSALIQRACGSVIASLALCAGAWSGPVQERVAAQHSLRVCIWPDYYGITFRDPRTQQLTGIDIDLSAELGKDLKVKVDYVDSSFTAIAQDLRTDRCDVGMFAIGMLPQRMTHLRFTQPYLSSDIYGITTQSNAVIRKWSDIDQPGVLVAVQAGSFMEPVMGERLKHAKLVRISPPAMREQELESGRVDVFMTDYPYSRRLLDSADWARLVSPPQPVYVLPYAYAVKPGDDAWHKTLDDFVGNGDVLDEFVAIRIRRAIFHLGLYAGNSEIVRLVALIAAIDVDLVVIVGIDLRRRKVVENFVLLRFEFFA